MLHVCIKIEIKAINFHASSRMALKSPKQHARNLLRPFMHRKPVISLAAQIAGLHIFPSSISFHTMIHLRCCPSVTSQNFPVSLFFSCLSPSQKIAQASVLHVLMNETENMYGEASWHARADTAEFTAFSWVKALKGGKDIRPSGVLDP